MDSPTLSLHLFNLNPSFQAQDNFHDFLQAHISSTLLYTIPVLLQKRMHTPISDSLLTIYTLLCATRFYFSHFLQNAPGWCDCPWGANLVGFSQCSSSLQCLTLQTTSWHFSSLVAQSTTLSRFSYFSDNSFFLLLNGGVFSALPFLHPLSFPMSLLILFVLFLQASRSQSPSNTFGFYDFTTIPGYKIWAQLSWVTCRLMAGKAALTQSFTFGLGPRATSIMRS